MSEDNSNMKEASKLGSTLRDPQTIDDNEDTDKSNLNEEFKNDSINELVSKLDHETGITSNISNTEISKETTSLASEPIHDQTSVTESQDNKDDENNEIDKNDQDDKNEQDDENDQPSENNDIISLKSTEAILDTNEDQLNQLSNKNSIDDSNSIIGNDENDVPPTEQELNPSLSRFMTACQQGDLSLVTELINSKQVQANDCFSDGITALHWASINNRLSVVKFLTLNEISKSDPNLLGGDLKATPLHWACRNGLVYIVDHLITNTQADPTIRDAQSYNALHLSIHSSNITLIIYLLLTYCGGNKDDQTNKKKLYIDEPDSANRTSLHWAAYQGDLLTVNALLRFGADVNKVDDSIFIPLHWAFMKGYKAVFKTLLEAGSDIFAKNDQGKDSFAVAQDMNCYETWVKVLTETGRSSKRQWTIKQYLLKEKHAKLITFFTPYLLLPTIFHICSFNNGFAIPKLFLSVIITLASVFFLLQLVIPIYIREEKALFKTPFLAGIFSSTTFWCIIVWITKILPATLFKSFIFNLLLGGFISLFVGSFFKAMFINPGFVPTPSDNSIILDQVKELIKLGKFDTDNFCIYTYVRKPLRSRYSRHNKKLVARFDHYCPWIYNEVGVRNHKLFMTFVYSLTISVILFISLSVKYFDISEDKDGYDSDDESLQCSILPDELCVGFNKSPFHFNLLIWCIIQLVWIGFLCVVQTFQILKGLTTWEFSLLNSKISNSPFNHSTLPRDFNDNLQPSITPHINKNQLNGTGLGMCAKLIGLDQFLLTVKLTVQSIFYKTTHRDNYTSLNNIGIPTDYGLKQNWKDFWFLGDIEWRNIIMLPIEGENNLNGQVVDYYKLYELPPKFAGNEAV